jgi:hypothetical protein
MKPSDRRVTIVSNLSQLITPPKYLGALETFKFEHPSTLQRFPIDPTYPDPNPQGYQGENSNAASTTSVRASCRFTLN